VSGWSVTVTSRQFAAMHSTTSRWQRTGRIFQSAFRDSISRSLIGQPGVLVPRTSYSHVLSRVHCTQQHCNSTTRQHEHIHSTRCAPPCKINSAVVQCARVLNLICACDCAWSQCAMGQLVRGIRLGDRRSAHMRSSAFARTCVQRHLRIDPFSVPRRSVARPSASPRDSRGLILY
jgi:hypothetical protein